MSEKKDYSLHRLYLIAKEFCPESFQGDIDKIALKHNLKEKREEGHKDAFIKYLCWFVGKLLKRLDDYE